MPKKPPVIVQTANGSIDAAIGACPGEVAHRIAGIRDLSAPGVLTDGETEKGAVAPHRDRLAPIGRDEVAVLVEDVVGRQKALRLGGRLFAAAQQDCRVGEMLGPRRFHRDHRAQGQVDPSRDLGQLLEFGPGEVVFRQGDRGDRLFVVKSGVLEVLSTPSDASEPVPIAYLGTGEVLGELAIPVNVELKLDGADLSAPLVEAVARVIRAMGMS